MNNKPNILFVCGKNISRSRTAEQIFRQDQRFCGRSAGLSPKSTHQISIGDVDWADTIVVMEQSHKKQILKQYNCDSSNIHVLDIQDMYQYMDKELIQLLHEGVDDILSQ